MKNRIIQFCLISAALLLIIKGEAAINYAQEAMQLCYYMIIPTLFPFFICSGLLIYSGFCESLARIFAPVMKPLFNINPNGSAAFILGIISGYPSGAVTVCQLYESRYISRAEAERLLAFCNNSGPLFILGSVGIGLYAGLGTGLLLYAAHILGAVSVGVLFSFYKRGAYKAPESVITVNKDGIGAGFGSVMENSVRSILTVCGAVIFFSVISRLCLDLVPVRGILSAMVYGVCEFATGVVRISGMETNFALKLILSSFIVGFAGISVHIQVLSIVSGYGLSMKPYIVGKLLHGVLSAGFMWLILYASDIKKSAVISLDGGFMMNSVYIIASVAVIGIAALIFKNKVLTSRSI